MLMLAEHLTETRDIRSAIAGMAVSYQNSEAPGLCASQNACIIYKDGRLTKTFYHAQLSLVYEVLRQWIGHTLHLSLLEGPLYLISPISGLSSTGY